MQHYECHLHLAHYWHTSTKNERPLATAHLLSCCFLSTYQVGTVGFGQSLVRLLGSCCRNCIIERGRKAAAAPPTTPCCGANRGRPEGRRRYTPLPVRGMRKTTLCRFSGDSGRRCRYFASCMSHDMHDVRHSCRPTLVSAFAVLYRPQNRHPPCLQCDPACRPSATVRQFWAQD